MHRARRARARRRLHRHRALGRAVERLRGRRPAARQAPPRVRDPAARDLLRHAGDGLPDGWPRGAGIGEGVRQGAPAAPRPRGAAGRRAAGGRRARDGVDEPRRHRARAPAGLHEPGRHRQLPGRGHGRPGPADLRGAVPSRGRAHPAGQDGPQELPRRGGGHGRLVHAVVRGLGGRRHPAPGRQGPRALRAVGRRGLLGGRGPDPQGGGRSAHVPLRGQRSPAEGRGRRGRPDLPRRLQDEPDPCRCK